MDTSAASPTLSRGVSAYANVSPHSISAVSGFQTVGAIIADRGNAAATAAALTSAAAPAVAGAVAAAANAPRASSQPGATGITPPFASPVSGPTTTVTTTPVVAATAAAPATNGVTPLSLAVSPTRVLTKPWVAGDTTKVNIPEDADTVTLTDPATSAACDTACLALTRTFPPIACQDEFTGTLLQDMPCLNALQQFARGGIFLLFCLFLMALVLNLVTARMPNPAEYPQLPDLGLELTPWWPDLEHVTDLFLWFNNIMVIVLYFLLRRVALGRTEPVSRITHLAQAAYDAAPATATALLTGSVVVSPPTSPPPGAPISSPTSLCCEGPSSRQARRDINRTLYLFPTDDPDLHMIAYARLFMTYALTMLARCVVNAMTAMPPTDNACRFHPPEKIDVLHNVLMTFVTFGAGSSHCGDLMFSGHSVCVCVTLLTLWTYGPLVHRFFRPAAVTCALTTVFTILSSRSHYTDDIVVAYLVTIGIYAMLGHHPYGMPRWSQFFMQPFWWTAEDSIFGSMGRGIDRLAIWLATTVLKTGLI